MSTVEIIQRCEELYEDPHFNAAREWKAADPSRRVVGYMPVYVPREILHAGGILPLTGNRSSGPGATDRN